MKPINIDETIHHMTLRYNRRGDERTVEQIEEHLRSLIGKFKRQSPPPMLLDAEGRNFEDPYYTQCLSCGRMVLVGKCCDEYVTLSIIDKGK